MSLYQIQPNGIAAVPSKSFPELGLKERSDLQRLLKSAIHVVSPDTLVIAEEFSDWEDSRRRIDLLGLDSDGSLVVIELKRTEDGGHMELQAIRYAAMISTMTFERVVDVYSRNLGADGLEKDAQSSILEHLGWSVSDEGQIGTRVRIVLVSADFSKEITTSVLWLNDQGLDIRCVRMTAHEHEGKVLLDVQQVLPLPEAEDYMVKQRERSIEIRSSLTQRTRNYDKYTVTVGATVLDSLPKRRAVFEIVRHLVNSGVSPKDIQSVIGEAKTGMFYKVLDEHKKESGVSVAASNAEEFNAGRKFDPRRWFLAETEPLRVDGYTYLFTNQWGTETENCMALLVDKFAERGIGFRRADESAADR